MEHTLMTQQKKEPTPAERPWPPPQGEWTYEDWLKLPDDGYRYEVINGALYMTPLPRPRHQRVSFRLARRLSDFAEEHHLGEVLVAPVGVRLPNQPVPFQPDILFIRAERLDIIGEENVEGVPDLIVEVLSPSNWLYDRREKMKVYEEAGVPEYWIVDPRTRTVEIYVLEEGAFLQVGQYGPGEVARSQVLVGFEVLVDEIFPD
jgi:Uma2 family endonuclease